MPLSSATQVPEGPAEQCACSWCLKKDKPEILKESAVPLCSDCRSLKIQCQQCSKKKIAVGVSLTLGVGAKIR